MWPSSDSRYRTSWMNSHSEEKPLTVNLSSQTLIFPLSLVHTVILPNISTCSFCSKMRKLPVSECNQVHRVGFKTMYHNWPEFQRTSKKKGFHRCGHFISINVSSLVLLAQISSEALWVWDFQDLCKTCFTSGSHTFSPKFKSAVNMKQISINVKNQSYKNLGYLHKTWCHLLLSQFKGFPFNE